jgi:hypothetical protein
MSAGGTTDGSSNSSENPVVHAVRAVAWRLFSSFAMFTTGVIFRIMLQVQATSYVVTSATCVSGQLVELVVYL